MWQELNGVSVMEIDSNPKTSYSSIQKTRTFHPATNDIDFLLSQLSKHAEEACRKARHYKLAAKKFSFFLKTSGFKYSTCSVMLPSPTNSPEILIPLIRERFKTVHTKGVPYRTTGVILEDLIPDSVSQKDLFGNSNQSDKFKLIHERIDSLEEKFGKNVVYLASTHKAMGHKEKGTDSDEIDRDLLFL